MKKILKSILVILILALSTSFVHVPVQAYEEVSNYSPDEYDTYGLAEYQCYVRGKGWTNWIEDDVNAGTKGQALPIEGMRIKFKSNVNVIPGVHVEYRVHVSNIGWMNWVRDGEVAGVPGQNEAIEAYEIRIVNDDGSFSNLYSVYYTSHISNIGDEGVYRENGETSGTVGKSLPIESFSVAIVMEYKLYAHIQACIQDRGWQEWNKYGMAGTVGEAKSMTGIKLTLPTNVFDTRNLHIAYRVHVQNIGWMDWVQDGQVAGAPDRNLPIEAIEIKLVDNNGNLSDDYEIAYVSHIRNIGWEENPSVNGQTSGTVGRALPIEALETLITNEFIR